MERVAGKLRRALGRAGRRLLPRPIVLMYHRVARPARDPWQLAVSPEHFAEHLQVVRQHGPPLALRDLTRLLAEGRRPRRGIVVTFDDGYVDNLVAAAPLLARSDVPSTLFVAAGCLGRTSGFWWDQLERVALATAELPSTLRLEAGGRVFQHELGPDTHYSPERQAADAGWRAEDPPPTERHRLFLGLYCLLRPLPDSDRQTVVARLTDWAGTRAPDTSGPRPMTAPELATLAGGPMEIGAHTLTHPQLSALDHAAQQAEIRGSRRALQEAVGGEISSFAYPYGARSDYTPETVALVREAGFSGACATTQGTVGRDTNVFELPRFHVPDCDGDAFARRVAGWLAGT